MTDGQTEQILYPVGQLQLSVLEVSDAVCHVEQDVQALK